MDIGGIAASILAEVVGPFGSQLKWMKSRCIADVFCVCFFLTLVRKVTFFFVCVCGFCSWHMCL